VLYTYINADRENIVTSGTINTRGALRVCNLIARTSRGRTNVVVPQTRRERKQPGLVRSRVICTIMTRPYEGKANNVTGSILPLSGARENVGERCRSKTASRDRSEYTVVVGSE